MFFLLCEMEGGKFLSLIAAAPRPPTAILHSHPRERQRDIKTGVFMYQEGWRRGGEGRREREKGVGGKGCPVPLSSSIFIRRSFFIQAKERVRRCGLVHFFRVGFCCITTYIHPTSHATIKSLYTPSGREKERRGKPNFCDSHHTQPYNKPIKQTTQNKAACEFWGPHACARRNIKDSITGMGQGWPGGEKGTD